MIELDTLRVLLNIAASARMQWYDIHPDQVNQLMRLALVTTRGEYVRGCPYKLTVLGIGYVEALRSVDHGAGNIAYRTYSAPQDSTEKREHLAVVNLAKRGAYYGRRGWFFRAFDEHLVERRRRARARWKAWREARGVAGKDVE